MALRKFWDVDLENNPWIFALLPMLFLSTTDPCPLKSLLHYLLYAKSLLLYGSSPSINNTPPSHKRSGYRPLQFDRVPPRQLQQRNLDSCSLRSQNRRIFPHQPRNQRHEILDWSPLLSIQHHHLMGQLVIDGKSHAPSLLPPIRCPKTHRFSKGSLLAIAAQEGLNYIDNGCMMLDDVRIPRPYLLGKYGSVDKKEPTVQCYKAGISALTST